MINCIGVCFDDQLSFFVNDISAIQKSTGTAAAEICSPSAEPGDQPDISELTSDYSLYIAAKSAHCIDFDGCGNLPDKVRQHQIYRHMHPQPSLVNPS